ncbi:HIT family protein [Macrococcus animalis]|uniref:HIT family protein n=1 Tax=Macrococcus animalis TaxID=3395467 RepID=UPI0039BE8883
MTLFQTKHLKIVTGAEGINIVSNNEAASNQVVFHTHIHIIPRYTDDGIDMKSTPHPVPFELLNERSSRFKL